jgi:hypothetical protein
VTAGVCCVGCRHTHLGDFRTRLTPGRNANVG